MTHNNESFSFFFVLLPRFDPSQNASGQSPEVRPLRHDDKVLRHTLFKNQFKIFSSQSDLELHAPLLRSDEGQQYQSSSSGGGGVGYYILRNGTK